MPRLLCCCLLITAWSCSKNADRWVSARPATVKVSGLLEQDGTPLESATITLIPTVETGHSAYARTDATGRFSLTTFEDGDGAVPGDYKITVSKVIVDFKRNPEAPDSLPPLYYKQTAVVHKAYGNPDSSKLTATIVDGQDNTLDLHVSSKGP